MIHAWNNANDTRSAPAHPLQLAMQTKRGWQTLNTTDPINEEKNQREENSIHDEDEQRETNAKEIRRPKAQKWKKRHGYPKREQRWNRNQVRTPEPQQRHCDRPKQDYG